MFMYVTTDNMNIDNIEEKVNKYRLKQLMKNHTPRPDAKFKCHQCNKEEYTIKWNIIISNCCNKEYSIDYLYLHTTPTYSHTR